MMAQQYQMQQHPGFGGQQQYDDYQQNDYMMDHNENINLENQQEMYEMEEPDMDEGVMEEIEEDMD